MHVMKSSGPVPPHEDSDTLEDDVGAEDIRALIRDELLEVMMEDDAFSETSDVSLRALLGDADEGVQEFPARHHELLRTLLAHFEERRLLAQRAVARKLPRRKPQGDEVSRTQTRRKLRRLHRTEPAALTQTENALHRRLTQLRHQRGRIHGKLAATVAKARERRRSVLRGGQPKSQRVDAPQPAYHDVCVRPTAAVDAAGAEGARGCFSLLLSLPEELLFAVAELTSESLVDVASLAAACRSCQLACAAPLAAAHDLELARAEELAGFLVELLLRQHDHEWHVHG